MGCTEGGGAGAGGEGDEVLVPEATRRFGSKFLRGSQPNICRGGVADSKYLLRQSTASGTNG